MHTIYFKKENRITTKTKIKDKLDKTNGMEKCVVWSKQFRDRNSYHRSDRGRGGDGGTAAAVDRRPLRFG